MKLPNSLAAYIPDPKLYAYLLSASHPEGGPKSEFFAAVGYPIENAEALRREFLRIARSDDVRAEIIFEFGVKYVVEGLLAREDGPGIPIRTIWVIDKRETAPRFVSAYPL
jgi:uncharacterized protein DUF6883